MRGVQVLLVSIGGKWTFPNREVYWCWIKKASMSSPKEMLCMWRAVEVLCKSKDMGFNLLNPQNCWPFMLKLLQEGGS